MSVIRSQIIEKVYTKPFLFHNKHMSNLQGNQTKPSIECQECGGTYNTTDVLVFNNNVFITKL